MFGTQTRANAKNRIAQAAATLATAAALVSAAGIVNDAHADFRAGDHLFAANRQVIASNDQASLVFHGDGAVALHRNTDGKMLWLQPRLGNGSQLRHDGLFTVLASTQNNSSIHIGGHGDLVMDGCGFKTVFHGHTTYSKTFSCPSVPETAARRNFDGDCLPLDRWSTVMTGPRARMLTTPWGEVGIWTNDSTNRQVWSSSSVGSASEICFSERGYVELRGAGLVPWRVGASSISMKGCGAVLWGPNGDNATLGDTKCPDVLVDRGSFSISDGFGNDRFGAGYAFGAGVEQADMAYGMDPYTRAYAYGNTWGRVFGRQETILGASAEAISTVEDSESVATLTVMGQDMQRDLGWNDVEIASVSKTFFKKSQTFTVGPIPVVVEGKLTGELGMTGHARPGATGFSIGARPYANLTASGSAGVGVLCASAGIYGNLTLIEVGVPTSLNVMVHQDHSATVNLRSDVEIESLSGDFGIYANACGPRAQLQLASWDAPLGTTLPIVNQTLTIN